MAKLIQMDFAEITYQRHDQLTRAWLSIKAKTKIFEDLNRRRAAAKRKKLKLVSGAGGSDPPEEEEDPEEDSSLAGTGELLSGGRELF